MEIAIKRILIIKPSSLGDVATTLPMAVDLKAKFPDATVDWLIHPALRALVDGHAAVEGIIEFDRKGLAGWWFNPSATRALLALRRRLRDGHYDCVIDAQGLLRTALFAHATRAPMRIGFASAREGAALFYTHKVSLPKGGKEMLAVDRMRSLLKPLGIAAATPARFQLSVSESANKSFDSLLEKSSLGMAKSYIAVLPGARWPTKRWPEAKFAEIVRRLCAARETILLAGSPDEAELCRQIAEKMPGNRIVNFAGQTTLAEMIALLARAKLVIGNDSGPLHVAVALGRPIVGLYGPTDPNYVGPYGQMDHVVRFDVECHPCRRKTCDHHSCMAGLTVETVWEKVQSVLAESGSS